MLIDPGVVRLRRPVVLALRDELAANIDQATALQRVRDALVHRASAFAPLAADTDAAAFQVVVNVAGEFEVWDAAGATLPNLRPALAIHDPRRPPSWPSA